MNQIFWRGFIIFEKLRYRAQLLLKLRAVEVATLFLIEYRLDQLNNKREKTAVNKFIHKYSAVTSIFDLHIFGNETAALLRFFEISTEMHIVCLFFLNERNISTSLLMIHLKCTVVHYVNLNSSSINKSLLDYRPLKMLFCFFQILIYVYFNETFVNYFKLF